MANRSKQKGTAAESAIVRFLREHGWPHVERRALNGSLDRGDLAGIPGLTCEIKSHRTMRLGEWLDEVAVEQANDGAALGVVWHKRIGTTDPGKWFVTMSGHAFTELLRDAGYGPPRDQEETT